jgi:hypothetical protein
VTLRFPYRLAASLGLALGLTMSARAADPPRPITPAISLPANNQQLADILAARLRDSGRLQNYTVDIRVQGGVVELNGTVADQPQHEEVLRLVQGVPGVERVIDRVCLTVTPGITRVQAPPVRNEPPGKLPEPIPEGPRTPNGPSMDRRPAPPAGGIPVPGPGPEPAPMFQAPAPGPYDLSQPRMPPYAWPTYAPYNNFSRVAYPEAYPYNAWPFIGPVYPFPKIPLGWRSVKLEWDDGYWWFSRVANKCDWWRLRYW